MHLLQLVIDPIGFALKVHCVVLLCSVLTTYDSQLAVIMPH